MHLHHQQAAASPSASSAARIPRPRRADTLDAHRARFGLHPRVVEAVRGWKRDPQLHGLYDSLVAHSSGKSFLDKYAEVMVARRLLKQGCTFEIDVPTPNGKSVDFMVRVGGYDYFLHVKRLSSKHGPSRSRVISSRLRYLEQLPYPYTVNIRWDESLDHEDMQTFVTEVAKFIQTGHVGDEYVFKTSGGREQGGARILGPWSGTHVKLLIGKSTGFVDDVGRIQRLLRRAEAQFMPGAINLVLVAADEDRAATDLETVLLGSHVERWDAFPAAGRRIAHGRASDGLWYDKRQGDFKAAGVFRFLPELDDFQARLWVRSYVGIPTPVIRHMVDVFHTIHVA